MSHFAKSLIVLPGAALLLAGCLNLGGNVPPRLLNLTATSAPANDAARSGTAQSALTVVIPAVPQKLRTARVPVETGGSAVAYLKDAQWVEPPARLFQRLLSETLSATQNRLVLTETELISAPGELLSGDLLNFGVDADRNEAVVTYQALRLTNDGATISQRRFEARESVGELTPGNAGAALNRAANRVAGDVAVWMAQ
ncbi:ABC transporter [Sphingomonas lacunae]|uniref:ABC transporter n=1 Tax=Sphingomonas lacunae TaxID=2698828 RepID=A0A6M4AT69_9SPHN|nr:ABC-type transport auxiliary lipoprotein family protein [Sphingomonas lacunae]QJQ32308.1 ABC transporter [Sphingomonas lacunae]